MDHADLQESYDAVRTRGGALDRGGRGLLRLTGPQRIWFLQNTVTADIDELPEGRWTGSCFLDPKGKVLSHFRVGVADDEVWLDVDPPSTADLVDWFTRYRFRTKVEIEDLSAACVAVLGPPATSLAEPGEFTSRDGRVVFGDRLGDVPLAIVHGAAPDELPSLHPGLWDVLRIESGRGEFGTDYGPDTLPQEAGLTTELSVTKGCYVGQEVVARLHFRGHVNRVVRPLRFAGGMARPGEVLTHEGQQVGRVTSAVLSPGRGPIGLGMVRVSVPAGATVETADGPSAEVGEIPEGTKTERTPPARA